MNRNFSESNFRNDSELSLKAKAIMYYALELPEEEKFTAKNLESTVLDCKSSIKTAIQELEIGGYLYREKSQPEKLRFYKWDYIFSETPLRKEQFKKLKE